MLTVLTVLEAAERMRCSASYVRKLVRQGRLRAVVDGRYVRVPEGAVEEFLEAHQNGPRPPATPPRRLTCPAPRKDHLRPGR